MADVVKYICALINVLPLEWSYGSKKVGKVQCIKQILVDSIFQCMCNLIMYRECQNVAKTKQAIFVLTMFWGQPCFIRVRTHCQTVNIDYFMGGEHVQLSFT